MYGTRQGLWREVGAWKGRALRLGCGDWNWSVGSTVLALSLSPLSFKADTGVARLAVALPPEGKTFLCLSR